MPHGDAGQWPKVAYFWQQIGPPLRPAAEDIEFARRTLADWLSENRRHSPRGYILGVTPEYFHLPWPPGSVVRAADRTSEMITHVWPGKASDVLVSDWRHVNFPDQSFDIALCDGGWHLLDFPDGQVELANKLAGLLKPGARFLVRLFVPPPRREDQKTCSKSLLAGDIPNLNCLKLRLGMSLQESPSAGIALNQVWLSLRSTVKSWSELASRLGWSLDHLSAIDAYRDSQARYHFVTVDQAKDVLCDTTDGLFELDCFKVPSYAMGEQCPTLVLRRTGHPKRHD